MGDNTVHIALQSNERYAPQAAAMLRSVLASNDPRTIAVHYMHGGDLTEASQAKLRRMIESRGGQIHFYAIDPERARGLPVLKQLPEIMWYRVFLPGLLPKVSRVLYLDCDMVIEDSLAPLYHCDMQGNWVGAVTAPFTEVLREWPLGLGLPNAGAYFASGVLLFDLDQMRAHNCEEQVFAYGRLRGSALHWPDQDALNHVMHAHRLNLHPRWNFMNGIARRWGTESVFLDNEVSEATHRPAIIHFEGHNVGKPWQAGCRHPHRHLYFHYLRMTPFADQMPPRTAREALRERYLVLRAWAKSILKPSKIPQTVTSALPTGVMVR